MRTRQLRVASVGVALAATLAAVPVAEAKPIQMPTIAKEIAQKQAASAAGVEFPAIPCPENGVGPSIVNSVSGAAGQSLPIPVGNCGIQQPIATGAPWPGRMAYYGGKVQTHPKEYLVLWGWGGQGAFPGRHCQPVTLTEPLADGTTTSQILGCDPDHAGKYMADFLAQLGGTQWAGSQTQYYQTDASGNQIPISNDPNVLAGIWIDNGNHPDLTGSDASSTDLSKNTNTLLAAEATRAAAHFGVKPADLINANFIIAQPQGYSDPNAQSLGYCAWHDYTESDASGNWYYKDNSVFQGILGKSPGIAFTNMPYVLNNGSSCGEDAVNSKTAGGDLDGFSIVLGHEVEETITDPAGEATVGNAGNLSQTTAAGGGATFLGGWYDSTDPNENGDKCAWVGQQTNGLAGPMPGTPGNIAGNQGERFAVQSLWSNKAAQGIGYCSGVAGSDLPSALGDGEVGGKQYPQTTEWTKSTPPLTCNEPHLFVDNSLDGKDLLTPNPNSPLSGTEVDSLDVTQGDLTVADGKLKFVLTIRNLTAQAPTPATLLDYQLYWSGPKSGTMQWGAEVQIDGQGNVTGSDGTMNMSGTGNPFYTSSKTLTPKITPGKNGTIEIDVPLADAGNPTTGSVLGTFGVQTLDAANGNNPVINYNPGFYADQDGNESTYTIGNPTCVEPVVSNSDSTVVSNSDSSSTATSTGDGSSNGTSGGQGSSNGTSGGQGSSAGNQNQNGAGVAGGNGPPASPTAHSPQTPPTGRSIAKTKARVKKAKHPLVKHKSIKKHKATKKHKAKRKRTGRARRA